ncbi:MAG: hydroxymethylbilane synthase [Hahellaceae bacterium]|nr:hydroxymethylbilane synthase [Hahellaceae bacterium]
MSGKLVIATRESALAMWQALHVKARLESLHPGLEVQILGMKTQGDKILDVPLAKIGGKGLFVKELETALLSGEADIAVHSMKDVPMELPEGLILGAILAREIPFDALVSHHYASLGELPQGAIVGTSSLRRQSQLMALRPDLQIRSLRGNVNTRLSKLDAGEFDAIILAAAGLTRLGFGERIRQVIPADIMLPAVGQGVLGIECRTGDSHILNFIAPLIDPETDTCVKAERAFNHRLQGGCQVPIGGFATLQGDALEMTGLVASLDGREKIQDRQQAKASAPESLGIALADTLLAGGADRLLKAVYGD